MQVRFPFHFSLPEYLEKYTDSMSIIPFCCNVVETSGLIHIRSNCATKMMMNTLIHYIGAHQHHTTDQTHWNMVLKEFKDRIKFELLPVDEFVNGNNFGMPAYMVESKFSETILEYKYDRNKMWFAHASWTGEHAHKVKNFKTIDAWYFEESCPYWQEHDEKFKLTV